jgi:hypothetical protein
MKNRNYTVTIRNFQFHRKNPPQHSVLILYVKVNLAEYAFISTYGTIEKLGKQFGFVILSEGGWDLPDYKG